MGTSTSATQLADKMMRAARTMETQRKQALRRIGEDAADVYERQMASDGLRKGAPLAGRPWKGVRSAVDSTSEVAVWASPPAHLWNNRTRPHPIMPKAYGSRRRRSRLAWNKKIGQPTRGGPRAILPGTGPKSVAWHPGTRGSGSWQKATPKVRQKLPEIQRRQLVNQLSPIFN